MKTRIGYIDGLRAVAVLSVIAHHAAKYNVFLSAGAWQHSLYEGAHGVDLFFVISGFCLSYPTLVRIRNEGKSSFDVARYLAHRLIRILPPYYFAIAFCWLLLLLALHYQWVNPFGTGRPDLNAVEVLRQMVFADRGTQLLNGSFWSLAVEFRWYFLFPLVLVLWVESPRAFGLLGLGFFLAASQTRAASIDLAILPAFMLGIVAADVEIRCLPIRRLAPLLFILALSAALLLEPNDPWHFYDSAQIGWQAAAFFFVIAAGCNPLLRTLLSWRPLVAVGLASYSMYLIHEPVIGLLERNTPMGSLAAAVIAGALGIVFWAIFERPFTETALKPILTRVLGVALGRIFRFGGIPAEIWVEGTGLGTQHLDRFSELDVIGKSQPQPIPEPPPRTGRPAAPV